MLLGDLRLDPADFTARTGWDVKPEGLCKGPVCVPLPDGAFDASTVAAALGMPLVADDAHGLWALGPETGVTGRALTTAEAPDLELPDVDGNPFKLRSLLGMKVVLVAWASW